MANPTSNFNWQMPTPTDLVTDLPADFEVFGQAVDSSMADLLGGTTGQILAKNSNTNMDFVWIANDQGDITGITASSPLTGGGTSGAVTVGIQDATTAQKGAVQLENSTSSTSTTTAAVPASVKAAYDLADGAIAKSTVTTAGDVIYRNATVPVRLGIGTAGQVLTVNSGATAPEWATPATPTSGITLINRSSFTNVANTGTTFDTIFSATYKTYMIVVETISAAVSVDDIRVQFRNGSSTISAANYYGANFGVQYNGSTLITNNTNGVGHIILTADSDAGTSVTMYANNVGGTSAIASLRGTGHEQAKPVATCFSAGYFASSNIDGLIFSSASSNITGTVAIYGLAV